MIDGFSFTKLYTLSKCNKSASISVTYPEPAFTVDSTTLRQHDGRIYSSHCNLNARTREGVEVKAEEVKPQETDNAEEWEQEAELRTERESCKEEYQSGFNAPVNLLPSFVLVLRPGGGIAYYTVE